MTDDQAVEDILSILIENVAEKLDLGPVDKQLETKSSSSPPKEIDQSSSDVSLQLDFSHLAKNQKKRKGFNPPIRSSSSSEELMKNARSWLAPKVGIDRLAAGDFPERKKPRFGAANSADLVIDLSGMFDSNQKRTSLVSRSAAALNQHVAIDNEAGSLKNEPTDIAVQKGIKTRIPVDSEFIQQHDLTTDQIPTSDQVKPGSPPISRLSGVGENLQTPTPTLSPGPETSRVDEDVKSSDGGILIFSDNTKLDETEEEIQIDEEDWPQPVSRSGSERDDLSSTNYSPTSEIGFDKKVKELEFTHDAGTEWKHLAGNEVLGTKCFDETDNTETEKFTLLPPQLSAPPPTQYLFQKSASEVLTGCGAGSDEKQEVKQLMTTIRKDLDTITGVFAGVQEDMSRILTELTELDD